MEKKKRKRDRQVLLEIWCSPELRDRFKTLTAKYRFRSYEAFLKWLLDHAESEWLPERVY
jgi:hypothetical protein